MRNQIYSWATHQPVLKGVLQAFCPEFVLELGIGVHSTHLLVKAPSYFGVEIDREWIAKVKETLPNIEVAHHDLKGVTLGAPLSRLTKEQKENIIKYYSGIKVPQDKRTLLFVDSFVSVRGISMTLLKDKFDVIVFHDAQSRTNDFYGYKKVSLNDFKVYYLTSETSWTGIAIRNGVDADIVLAIRNNIEAFREDFGYKGRMEVIDG